MKLRIAKKIWYTYLYDYNPYNKYQFMKAYHIMVPYLMNHKTPKRLLHHCELSNLKDRILASDLKIGADLREYIRIKKLRRERKAKH